MNPGTITVGLRFRRSQLRILRDLIPRLQALGLSDGDMALFRRARDATERYEPLRVIASNMDEVRTMAALFARLGLVEPTIEEMR